MPASLTVARFDGPLARRLADPRGPDVVLHWLGQAGFVVTAGPLRLAVDPYLSDSLAEKYRGTALPHERMMPAPITVDALGPIDLVLLTHHHTDHMDPGTLRPLAAAQPALRFVVPRASLNEAGARAGVGAERLIPLDAGERIEPLPGLAVTALRAAHETLERDAGGHHRYLGYGLDLDGEGGRIGLVHSGDTVPYEGQAAEMAALHPDLALLPVNGRSPDLLARGVPGNLSLEEAVALAAAAGAPAMVAHHHGLFAFNTRPLAEIEALAAQAGLPIRLVPARPGMEIRLRPAAAGAGPVPLVAVGP